MSEIVTLERGHLQAALALNNAYATELSFQTPAQFARLVEEAFYARWHRAANGFLIAFDESAAYDGAHFIWFRERFELFVYVDRLVIDPACRRRGFASSLYRDLFDAALASGRPLVCCEVNQSPPNIPSDRFHDRFGFVDAGTGASPDGAKTVRYLVRDLRR